MATANKPSVAFDADTVVVITGSSRGLGLNLVKGILETTDSKVVATARNVAKASALSELQAKYPERVQLVNLDTGSEDSIKVCCPYTRLCQHASLCKLSLHCKLLAGGCSRSGKAA